MKRSLFILSLISVIPLCSCQVQTSSSSKESVSSFSSEQRTKKEPESSSSEPSSEEESSSSGTSSGEKISSSSEVISSSEPSSSKESSSSESSSSSETISSSLSPSSSETSSSQEPSSKSSSNQESSSSEVISSSLAPSSSESSSSKDSSSSKEPSSSEPSSSSEIISSSSVPSSSSESSSSSEPPAPIRYQTKYVKQSIYHACEYGEFINKTQYTYDNDFKQVTREIVTNQQESNPDDFHTLFKTINKYNDLFQLYELIDIDLTFGYYETKELYTYDSKGLLTELYTYEKNDEKAEFYLTTKEVREYSKDGKLTSILTYGSSENLIDKLVIEYQDNIALYKYYDSSYFDMQEPKDVIKYVTEINPNDLSTKVTSYYLISHGEVFDKEMLDTIKVYNLASKITKEEDYRSETTYSYNINGDLLECYEKSRPDWSEEFSYMTKHDVTYDDRHYLVSKDVYDIEESETLFEHFEYEVDELGYVTKESCYSPEKTLKYETSFVLSDLILSFADEYKKFEAYGPGTYTDLFV